MRTRTISYAHKLSITYPNPTAEKVSHKRPVLCPFPPCPCQQVRWNETEPRWSLAVLINYKILVARGKEGMNVLNQLILLLIRDVSSAGFA